MEIQTTQAFKPRITQVKGLSDRRRLPRLGIIRLGLKAKSKKTGNEYPTETEWFVCPEEVRKVFGEEPKELEVMIPINDLESVFPTAYKLYGSSRGLKCQGDGDRAYRVNDETKEMKGVACPCQLLEEGKCKQSANLMVMIPKVSVGGIYQIRTSSFNSIVDIQSGLDYVAALVGRFAMIPLKLRRVKTETYHDGKKQSHYTLQIILDANIDMINTMRLDTSRILEHPRFALPAPKDENPEFDPVDVVEEEENGKPETQSEPQPPTTPYPQNYPMEEPEPKKQPTLQERKNQIFKDLKIFNYSIDDMKNFALVGCGKGQSKDWDKEDIKILEDAIKKLQPPERTAGEGDN